MLSASLNKTFLSLSISRAKPGNYLCYVIGFVVSLVQSQKFLASSWAAVPRDAPCPSRESCDPPPRLSQAAAETRPQNQNIITNVIILGDSCILNTLVWIIVKKGARCSSMVRAFAYGAMGRWIDPSCWTHWAISHSNQCSTTGIIVVRTCMCLWLLLLLLF